MEQVDVLIVGAGLAGLYYANLVGTRLRTMVLTRRPVGAPKPCGELVCPEAQSFLDRLGIGRDCHRSPDPVPADVCFRGALLAQSFFNARRPELERSLWGRCSSQIGLRVVHRLDLRRQGGQFIATDLQTGWSVASRWLVAADGVDSSVRRGFGFAPASTIMLEQVHLLAATDRIRLVVDPTVTPGYYYWMIPKDERTLLGYRSEHRLAVMDHVAMTMPDLDLGRLVRRQRWPVTKIQSPSEVELGESGLFFLGEAAGLVMPSSGEGISSAFASAEALATSLVGDADDKNAAYAQAMEPRVAMLVRDIGRLDG